MADYNHREIEPKWQQFWKNQETFKAATQSDKPKFYALDMFPYPSGAGLHVGHPLGYIASDIVSRFKRNKGFNVLHPMGFDAFGLPAEQYAIQTGQHPAITTRENIARYKEQLKNIGFSFDWDKEVQTCDPDYYKWTQWIFMQVFDSWYDYDAAKARHINELTTIFAAEGNGTVNAACDEDTPVLSAEDWTALSEYDQQQLLLKYRLTYLSETTVNWCPEMGTVLSNDEVKDGFSERGGFPVVRKQMKQWSMRITAYAERLLQGLEQIDWPEPLKEMQRNWIGKSLGAELSFPVDGHDAEIKVFTTRIDTIFGVTFLTLAPESDLVAQLTTDEQRAEVEAYAETASNRSERDRMTDVKTISGVFTGSYATNPYNGEKVPIWVADYVLAGYGTGAVMAVPCGDQRDYDFAKHFDLPIVPVIKDADISEQADSTKDGTMINSGFLNGLSCRDAIEKAIEFAEEKGIGRGKVNFRIRDAIFARQRYWGEPVPVYFKNDIPHLVAEQDLPVILPEVDKYLPTEDGDPPLGRAENFTYTPPGETEAYPLELSTMPGWAGSSWYWYRYMDAHNDKAFVDTEVQQYWENVDLYIGGSEHATGHLLYSRFWNKILFDLGHVNKDEPFKKLINQGMIQGRSNLVFRLDYGVNEIPQNKLPQVFVSLEIVEKLATIDEKKPSSETKEQILKFIIDELNKIIDKQFPGYHADSWTERSLANGIRIFIDLCENDQLDQEAFRKWMPEYSNAEFITENGHYNCGALVEKMSKRYYNVVNPDDMVERYGADTLRLYEMFLGPLEQFKPWNTNGIDGTRKFLLKLWRLFHNQEGELEISDEQPTNAELKILHKTIKKAEEDIDRYSFNTSVSTFMICVNELSAAKCNKRAILEDLVVVVSPYAPHIAEELWSLLGHTTSVNYAPYPVFKEEYLKEDSFEYPVMINGKMRTKLNFPADMDKAEIEKAVLANETVQKWMDGKPVRKMIVVPKKIVNVVV